MTEKKLPAKTGRPPKMPPPGALETIREMSATGHSIVGIAQQLGTSKDTFNRWLDENPDLREAFDQGREKERHTLHNSLYEAALSGNATAAMFLLKSRHGYREGDQGDTANKVQITFALPGALPLDKFIDVTPPRKEIP